jgi:hypothetical protein
MHSTINIPGKDSIIKRPDKDTLPANFVKRNTGCGVALGVYNYLLSIDA